jgi:SAM-dependent methyltransferase
MTDTEVTPRLSGLVVDTAGGADAMAPELRAFHDEIFDQPEDAPEVLYGHFEDWPKIRASGHFRRMEILAALDLGDLSSSTVVDFGTGPWGFGCVFPKLRQAQLCIGMDVSLKALEIASTKDQDIAHKAKYFTSDGESIPLQESSVDLFWGGEVIEHVREPRKFVQEIARVGRDASRVILSTPNRDAVYYHGSGQDYSIGPEHIAILTYHELKKILESFLTDVRIVGYETSLHPALDRLEFTESAYNLIQDRALDHPLTATGLIATGRVSKTLYGRNRREWALDEFTWFSPRVLHDGTLESIHLFGSVTGGCLGESAAIDFTVRGRKLVMLFWAHAWSGFASITIGTASHIVDLYSVEGGFRRLEYVLDPDEDTLVKISRCGRKNQASKHDQVIFFKSMVYSY